MTEILLAEDNQADVYLIREALKEHGVECAIRIVSDGQEVLRLIEDHPSGGLNLALIILDLNLPRHDGIEILESLHKSPELTGIPVVVLTSSDSPADRQAATRLGAARFLKKPSNLDQFLSLGSVFKELLQVSGTESV